MVWIALVVVGLFVGFGWVSWRRHRNDPHVMPYRSGHVGGLGEAPPGTHHRLGSRRT